MKKIIQLQEYSGLSNRDGSQEVNAFKRFLDLNNVPARSCMILILSNSSDFLQNANAKTPKKTEGHGFACFPMSLM